MKTKKKRPILLLTLLCALLFSACGMEEKTTETATMPKTMKEFTTETTTQAAPGETWIDPWDESYVHPSSEEPMAICNLFPDPWFALEVARLFEKDATDTVTYKELASYNGSIGAAKSPFESLEGIGYLTGVTELSFYQTGLKYIPPGIGNLKNLKRIYIYGSDVEILPKEIGDCESLEYFELISSDITTLPDEIGKLKNLKELILRGCYELTRLPDSICKLINLEHLDLACTKMEGLPEHMGNLQNLVYLRLFSCQLKTLPQSLRQCEKLEYLNVYDNFELDEAYKNWFASEVYLCGVDYG